VVRAGKVVSTPGRLALFGGALTALTPWDSEACRGRKIKVRWRRICGDLFAEPKDAAGENDGHLASTLLGREVGGIGISRNHYGLPNKTKIEGVDANTLGGSVPRGRETRSMETASFSVAGLLVLVLMGLFLIGVVIAVVALVAFLARRPAVNHSKNPNLRPCPDCGHFISVRAAACPHCGAPMKGA
jgi:hypothetical protein